MLDDVAGRQDREGFLVIPDNQAAAAAEFLPTFGVQFADLNNKVVNERLRSRIERSMGERRRGAVAQDKAGKQETPELKV